MNNVVIEVLDKEHGKKVIEFFKNYGVNTRNFTGKYSKSDGNIYRFYGIINGHFQNFSASQVLKYCPIILAFPEDKVVEEIKKIDMKVIKTKEITINNVTRKVTIAVVVEENVVKTGYAVCLPEDEFKDELADRIATGRALKEKTNLTPDMELGKGMGEKYILYAIADNIFKSIEKGYLVIKGIKQELK